MADIIFTKGTVAKRDLYAKIKELFISSGWKNISSKPDTDFDVLNSKGEAGDKNLTIQFKASQVNNTLPIDATDGNIMSYRLVEGYTPNPNSGTAGTFARTTEAWTNLYIVPTTANIPMDTNLTYYVNVNKNRLIMVIETPIAINVAPVTIYIGLPDTTWCSEPNSRGLLVATTAYAKTAISVHITNTAGELASENTSSVRAITCALAPKNPNSAGLYSISQMKYGNVNEGDRGMLSGIYALPTTGIVNGDPFEIGSKTFRVVLNQNASTNAFPSLALAIQIA